MTGLYPVVELGPSFQQYSQDVKLSLQEVNGALAGIYDLIEDLRINFINQLVSYAELTYLLIQDNTDGTLNAFRTLPLAPVGKLGGCLEP